MSLENYFDRVVLINLPRRPDRLAQVRQALRESQWPFKEPVVFAAVDGRRVPRPPAWKHSAGAWGCLQSHLQVLQQALADGVQNILVLEDDVCFAKNFRREVKKFLRTVPKDWDQLMLGGQHRNLHGEPRRLRPGVYRCTDCERTHCYAIRGQYLRKLVERWQGGGPFRGLAHCDWIMGRDPELQLAHKVYAPELFLAGQERGPSDIYGAIQPRKFWNPPDPNLAVVNLHAPAAVARALAKRGLCFGHGCGRDRDLDRQLEKVFSETKRRSAARVARLREWIKLMQWEVGSDPSVVCAIRHAEATPELVQLASPWQVYEVAAATVAQAIPHLPPQMAAGEKHLRNTSRHR